jgi:hypothetical protein
MFFTCRKVFLRCVVGVCHSPCELSICVGLHAGFQLGHEGGNMLDLGRKACIAVFCIFDVVDEGIVVPVNTCVDSLNLVVEP